MKRKNLVIIGIFIVIGISLLFLITNKSPGDIPDSNEPTNLDKAVHWHPRLSIFIDGKKLPMPEDIGYGSGIVIDTHLSGMRMSPTHTHENDGTIHIENNDPYSKPETLTLGYFFKVWDKPFNSTCIFEYCTNGGKLNMIVNGVENTDFANYVMQDNDEIVITYTTEEN